MKISEATALIGPFTLTLTLASITYTKIHLKDQLTLNGSLADLEGYTD